MESAIEENRLDFPIHLQMSEEETRSMLELYNHTNHQVAALNIYETSWPAYKDVLAYMTLPLLPPLAHLAADTTLYGSLS
jgi:hypothetical protein